MDLKPTDTLCGLQARIVRDAFAKIGHRKFDERGFVSIVDEDRKWKIDLGKFYEAGLVEGVDEDRDLLRLSSAGLQIAKTNFLKRMDRKAVDALKDAVLARANKTDGQFSDNPYRLASIFVFGSYLTDARTFGDIDLVVVLECRPELSSEELVGRVLDYADQYAPRSTSFLDRLGFAQTAIQRYLKNRSPRVDITPKGDMETLNIEPVPIWQRGGINHHTGAT